MPYDSMLLAACFAFDVLHSAANRTAKRRFPSAAGVRTVNVVRDRADLQQLREELQGLGATVVTTEEALKQDLAGAELPRPVLGLNCVGGSSSAAIAKALECAQGL